jgi:hypothetical protein
VNKGALLAVTPLMIVPVMIYNLFALTLPGGLKSRVAHASVTQPLIRLRTAGGGAWPVSPADLLLAAALAVLFMELVKSTANRRLAMINHGLSVLLFAICLAEMLLTPACATSTFFLVTLMVLLDVLAGFMVRVGPRRRGLDMSDVR